MGTTDRTPAQMAAELIDTFPHSPGAPLAIAESHRRQSRRKPDRAEYWAQVVDLLSTASER